MKQVIALKLEPSPEHHAALLATMQAFNRGAQWVADVAFERRCANKVALQPVVYGELRSRFGLSAQMAIRAIAKAVDAYKRDRRVHVRIDPHGAMVYDERIMSFKGLTHVSLLCLGGREKIPLRYGAYQAARIERAKGQADLVLRDGTFYLFVTIDLPTPPPAEVSDVLGIDLGIVQLATDSDGEAFSGEPVRAVRRRLKRIRALLQSKGTRSARRHLRRVKRKNGFNREMRWLLGNWAFDQLRRFVAYKAEAAGVPVYAVDPRNTSRTCHACGHCDPANRKSQARFLCLSCGLDAGADHNAALNIRARAAQSTGLLPRSSLSITSGSLAPAASPQALAGGR